ncbi:hypothetical protein PHLCEN_2v3901 [Hermanssonia centrifuga]|uniref:Uncharacterized protein n=1 Tax=Hermanssonia centrifuga TaxID=98765 RepID=A0A2R6QBA0_9APHY|nr:hypothetical protein PHLCEN_2v3901 [Hermanssonia centrifuga]
MDPTGEPGAVDWPCVGLILWSGSSSQSDRAEMGLLEDEEEKGEVVGGRKGCQPAQGAEFEENDLEESSIRIVKRSYVSFPPAFGH